MTYHRKCKEPGCYCFVVATQETSCYKCAHGLTPKSPYGWTTKSFYGAKVTSSNPTSVTLTWETS